VIEVWIGRAEQMRDQTAMGKNPLNTVRMVL
jgi:hypothetical protein